MTIFVTCYQPVPMNYQRLGKYIRPVDERNRDLKINLSQGICNAKYFQNPKQVADNPQTHKVVRTGQFAYNRATTRNGEKISIALREGPDCTVSSAYQVFEIIDENLLHPKYLMMWFKRPEFDRLAIYYSHGSAHEFFEWEAMCDVRLPVPPIERQREIVAEYETLTRRIHLNEQIIQRLEATAQALYRNTFVDNIDKQNLPPGWQLGTIEELSEFVVAGVIPRYVVNGEFKVLGQRCVHDHSIDMSFVKMHLPRPNCLYVKNGDVLINSTGSGTLGRAGQVFNSPQNLAFDSNMTLVRPKFDYLIDYLGFVIFDKEDYFVQISQGSTNQTRLYCSMVKPIEIVVPVENVLKNFTKYVRPMRYNIELRKQENNKLYELQSLLLAKMGQINI